MKWPWQAKLSDEGREIQKLVRWLGSEDAQKRLIAYKQLSGMGDAAFDEVMRQIYCEKSSTRRAIWITVTLWIVSTVVFFADFPRHHALYDISRYLTPVAFCGAYLIRCRVSMLPLHARSLRLLTDMRDPRAIGVLLEARGQKPLRKEIDNAVLKLLPYVKMGDVILTRPQCRALLQLASANEKEDTRIALDALARIGRAQDAEELETVLASLVPTLTPQLKKAYQRCLADLRARLDLERAAQTLLRPAQSPDDACVLLRPASAQPSDPQLLLHVVEEEG